MGLTAYARVIAEELAKDDSVYFEIDSSMIAAGYGNNNVLQKLFRQAWIDLGSLVSYKEYRDEKGGKVVLVFDHKNTAIAFMEEFINHEIWGSHN